MKTILVASSKGGAGKSTIATNLAATFALDGKRTVLVDADPQGSSTRWAERRAELESAVLPVDGTGRRAWRDAVPDDADRVVIDAAAGAMAADLESFLDKADAVVVPVLPSAMDIEATVGFLNTLAKVPRVHKRKLPVGLVVNRSKPWTNASQQAVEMLSTWPYPVVAQLRDTQAYVVLAGLGRSLFDYRSAQVRDHQSDWDPLLKWIKKA
ncbi:MULTISPECIES: ParA family protein [Pseudoxanthomonas]|jgi:chromosome partitioning protein|uniref:ParA family protein n=1 Tax=Pseudoxanthomonas TaxID=83618 RepID=UPI00160AF935|nr:MULTISPECIES: ParA family protein [Pseudoxanthomonas]MBB3276417.1 chromosome partitioning protein [Pseudoxanthomonas sp. OG2]MBD9377516.1 ParA family protein [Pseudoxanthomonas sp. PXM04]MBV7472507.1 ParA family protein [Pseudoxanthomonas sp. PXM05]UBB25278.1 ParA family protein [Pseudoxanthomonas japonensis]